MFYNPAAANRPQLFEDGMASKFVLTAHHTPTKVLTKVLRTPRQLRETDRITIAQYNVYNLFGNYAKNPKPDDQMEALGKVIVGLSPDVIAFAEVQNEWILRRLFQDWVNPQLTEADKYDAFVCIPANDRRGINVALVTRLSVRGAMTFHDREIDTGGEDPIRFSRDLLGVKIQATPDPNDTYIHFASHLKSQIGGAAAAEKRGLEATEIVNIFTEPTFGDRPFIDQGCTLGGDMNEQPDKAAVDMLRQGGLTDAFAAVEPNYTYPTAINQGALQRRYPEQRLDYIFTTPSMTQRLSEPIIYREEATDEASDHYPLTAVLRLT
jgi:endonuclease/exonuclease/phosphatase family metal-dependent hydrolase